MDIERITPAIFLKNEVYWVHYVVRDLLKVFGRLVVLDTGSTDGTQDVMRRTVEETGGELTLMQVDYGDNAHDIGNAPNILRETVSTEWMLLCGGDEIWPEPQLMIMLNSDIPAGCTVGMVIGRNVEAVDDKIVGRDCFNADRLFSRDVVWDKCKYPYEDHGLDDKLKASQVHYLNGDEVYYWHVRHLQRSPLDGDTFYRSKKRNYFPYDGPRIVVPSNWLGEISCEYSNPYLDTCLV